MSHEATSLVKSRAFGSVTRKAVALVLADYCDAGWSTFVGQARLAWEAEVGVRTVRGVLREFTDQDLIERQRRLREDGQGRTSDRITLNREAISKLPERTLDQPAGSAARTLDQPADDVDQPASHDRSSGTGSAGESLENRKTRTSPARFLFGTGEIGAHRTMPEVTEDEDGYLIVKSAQSEGAA